MRTGAFCPTMPSETLTLCWDFGNRHGCAWRETDATAHGFRSSASTLLNEEEAFDRHVVEPQLAHDPKKKRSGVTRWCGASLAIATKTRSARHL
jgi:hypothetical protein